MTSLAQWHPGTQASTNIIQTATFFSANPAVCLKSICHKNVHLLLHLCMCNSGQLTVILVTLGIKLNIVSLNISPGEGLKCKIKCFMQVQHWEHRTPNPIEHTGKARLLTVKPVTTALI